MSTPRCGGWPARATTRTVAPGCSLSLELQSISLAVASVILLVTAFGVFYGGSLHKCPCKTPLPSISRTITLYSLHSLTDLVISPLDGTRWSTPRSSVNFGPFFGREFGELESTPRGSEMSVTCHGNESWKPCYSPSRRRPWSSTRGRYALKDHPKLARAAAVIRAIQFIPYRSQSKSSLPSMGHTSVHERIPPLEDGSGSKPRGRPRRSTWHS